jgi:hypothetical protein
MNRKIIIVLLIVVLPFAAEALFSGILNKVKNKAKQRADNKIDREIDKSLDQTEGTKKAEQAVASTPGKEEPKNIAEEESAPISFSKYDFIPGEQILYYDNFEGEAISELPAAWNTSGTGEVTVLDKYPGNWLRLHKPFTYLSSNQKEFGENYTVEFDIIFQLKNNGWAYPELCFGLFASKDEPNGGNNFLRDQKNMLLL